MLRFSWISLGKQYEVKIAELILLPGQIKETLSDEEVTVKDLEDIDCNKPGTPQRSISQSDLDVKQQKQQGKK